MGVPSSPATKSLQESLNVVGKVVKTSKNKFGDWNIKLPKGTTKIPDAEFKKLSRAATFFREGHYTREDIKKIQDTAKVAKDKVKEAEKLAKESKNLWDKFLSKAKGASQAAKAVEAGGTVAKSGAALAKFAPILTALAAVGISLAVNVIQGWRNDINEDGQQLLSQSISKVLGLMNAQKQRIDRANEGIKKAELENQRVRDRVYSIEKQQPAIRDSIADAKKKSNDALYEVRAGKAKLEADIADAKKKSNDALYEARIGRTKLEVQIADTKKQANDALYETRTGRAKLDIRIDGIKQQVDLQKKDLDKYTGSIKDGFQQKIQTTVTELQKGLADAQTQTKKNSELIGIQSKTIGIVQEAVKTIDPKIAELKTSIVKLITDTVKPIEVKINESNKQLNEAEKKIGVVTTIVGGIDKIAKEAYDKSFEVVGAKWREEVIKNAKSIEQIHREGLLAATTQPRELKEIRDDLNKANANANEAKADSEKAKVDLGKTKVDLEKTKVDLEKAKVNLEKNKVDLEKNKVDSGKTKVDLEKTKVDLEKNKVDLEKTKVDLEKAKVDLEKNKVDLEKAKVDSGNNKVDLEKTKVDLEKTKVDVEKTKVDVEKTKVDVEKTKVDVEKADTKIKEQEKVNKDAIPKLDLLIGLVPLIPARAADAIRPSIPTIPQIENAAKTGTCQTFQPGGCGAKALDGLGNGINQNTNNQSNNLLDKLNAGANAVQLGLLKVIDNKLGNQITGGISGKLVDGFKWLQLDRALGLLTFAATVQNHLMLSNDIGQTLIGAFTNVLTLIGLKDDKGKAFDVGSVINSTVENFVKGIVGAENYTTISSAWAKANRIYQATTNVLNAFQNISSTILSGIELVAGQTGKIGNALRKSGEVLETAYGWMNPQPKINRITQTLEGLNQGASTIQQITQAPIDVIEAVTGLQTANTELVKAWKEDDKPANKGVETPEPDALKTKETLGKTLSAGKELADIDKEADEDATA